MMKLSTKLIGGFAVPMVILLSLSGMVAWNVHHVRSAAALALNESFVNSQRGQELRFCVLQIQQALNDASLTGDAESIDIARRAQAKVETTLSVVRAMFEKENDATWAAEVRKIGENFAAYTSSGFKMVDAYQHQGKDQGRKVMEEFDRISTALQEQINRFSTTQDEELKASLGTIDDQARALTRASMIGAGIAVLLTTLAAWKVIRSLTLLIKDLATRLSEGSEKVTTAAAEVSQASEQLATGASSQASSLEETSSALEEMAAMTRNNAANAKQVNDLAREARQSAEKGAETTSRLTRAMHNINDSSQKISNIIKVIEEIAFQTNLLALNAAVEAARAGEHGKGFAVVADEVRNLAQRATSSARETTDLISAAVQSAKEGVNVSGEVATSLGEIAGHVAKVSELVGGIATASEQQAEGVDQITRAVTQMDHVTQQTAAGAEESASAAKELSAQAGSSTAIVRELVTLVDGCRA